MGQFKKLLYNKRFVDSGDGESIAEWRINPLKVFIMFIGTAVALILLYGYLFTEGQDQQNYFGNFIFYSVVLCLAVGILWILAHGALKFRKLITGFMIAFILILVFYWFLGTIFEYGQIMQFHMGGHALWILLTFLAGLGAKRIDGNLDKNDVGYGLLVLIVLIGANIPITGSDGFLAMLDKVVFDNVYKVLEMFI